jgi:hypothetical protein
VEEAMAAPAAEIDLTALPDGLGASFRRIGLIGFWMQVVLGAVPLVTTAMVFLLMPAGPALSSRHQIIGVLSMVSLALLVFTAVWFLLYARVGSRIEAAGSTWRRAGLIRRVKVGIVASLVAIFLATIVILFEVAYLLFVFLDAPQGGMQVVAADPGAASWVSAIDMLSLLALNFTVTAEIVALGLGLMLLWRVTLALPEPAVGA